MSDPEPVWKDVGVILAGAALLVVGVLDGYRDALLCLFGQTTTAQVLAAREVPGRKGGMKFRVRYAFQDADGREHVAQDSFYFSSRMLFHQHQRTLEVSYWPRFPAISRPASAVSVVEPSLLFLLGIGLFGWAWYSGGVDRVQSLLPRNRKHRRH